MLTATGASFSYRSGGGVLPTDLCLQRGITALVGANGAGKSTLMGMLSGALRPRKGQVLLDNVDLYGKRRADVLPRVSLMPQSFSPIPMVTVVEFVRLFAWLRNPHGKDASRRVDEALETVDLLHRRNDPVRGLSGGMVRRLLLAQAIVSEPSVLILDEPTAGLDPLHRSEFRQLIRRLEDRVVLVSSHLLEDVGAFSSRVLVMADGAIVVDAPRAELPSTAEELEQEIIRRARLSTGNAR